MNYFEFSFKPLRDENESALVMAFLVELGFESFTEEDEVLIAYLPGPVYKEKMIDDSGFGERFPGISFTINLAEDKNWNEEWEKNYQPVLIAGKCYVRAPFHASMPDVPFEITIEPKMAFGTAHHETTQLVAAWLMDLEVSGLSVLDMGCGTGILAILANKMGAASVIGIDNDEWAERNASENFRLNGVGNGTVILGDASDIKPSGFDLILANINRNILLNDIPAYRLSLNDGGKLFMSGFYSEDLPLIEAKAGENGLRLMSERAENNWTAACFTL